MENVWQSISVDPLFRAYCDFARIERVSEPSSQSHTGKILTKIGRYTMLSHCFIDSLMVALNDSPKTCWQLVFYISRNIIGIGRNRSGDPKIYMKYKPTKIIEKANIKGVRNFYLAIETLKRKNIIFFKEEKNLYLNIFPLTWNIDENSMEKIREVVNCEIQKIEEKKNELSN